jgi:hypothetical protein
MKITLAKALAEVKLLDARIGKEVNNSIFTTTITGKKPLTNNNMTRGDFENSAKSSKQSIEDLIARRKQIKQKITLANATTKVTVGKEEFYIAEAIERKNSIQNDISYLNRLKQNLQVVESDLEKRNNQMESKLDSLLSDKMSSDKSKSEEVIEFQKSYRDLNETKIIDPLNIKELIKKLETEIEDFQSNIDFELSHINAITEIEI